MLMAVGYHIQPRLNLLYFLGTGRCTGEEYRAANLQAAADPDRRPGMHTIIDLLPVTELSVELSELQSIIASDRQLLQEGVYGETFKTAFVIRGEVDEFIGALYNAYVSGERLGVRAFENVMPALQWLELDAHRDAVLQLRADLLARLKD